MWSTRGDALTMHSSYRIRYFYVCLDTVYLVRGYNTVHVAVSNWGRDCTPNDVYEQLTTCLTSRWCDFTLGFRSPPTGREQRKAHGPMIMLCVPSLLLTHPWGLSWSLAARIPSDFQHEVSCAATPLSVSRVSRGRDFRFVYSNQFGTLVLSSFVAAPGGRCRGEGAVRMSSTPAEQPSVASKDGDGEKTTKTVNVIIKGKVQGVYYRNWTVDTAQQLGVNGWVRNMKNGSVEAVFSGTSTSVDSLIEKCHSGPPAARVSSVEVSPSKDEVPQGFERKPTIW